MNKNFFHIPKIKNVVFFGTSNIFEKFIKINKEFNLKTEIFTSKDQYKKQVILNLFKKEKQHNKHHSTK